MIDNRYYVNVKELMYRQLPKPKLKPKVFVLEGEWLPLISVEVEMWQ